MGMTEWGFASLLLAYLISAIPFGYLLIRLRTGADVRLAGSGNIGATNVLRVGGRGAGLLTLALDAGKGVVSVAMAGAMTRGDPRFMAGAAFCSVLGHCYPVYLKFRGGKGIATGFGAYATLAPVPMALALAVFGMALLVSRMVSVGSICAGLALPAFIWWLRPDAALFTSAASAALLVILRHRQNITRIFRGAENRVNGDEK